MLQSFKEESSNLSRKVKYFGFHLSQGQCQLDPERKQAVCSILVPTTQCQVQEFLGATGFCRICIPNFSILAKPLYEAIKGIEWESLLWECVQQKAFEEIKKALTNVPGLGLSDISEPFFLYVHEHTGIAVGVLTQM